MLIAQLIIIIMIHLVFVLLVIQPVLSVQDLIRINVLLVLLDIIYQGVNALEFAHLVNIEMKSLIPVMIAIIIVQNVMVQTITNVLYVRMVIIN